MARYNPETIKTDWESAISTFYESLQELAEEVREAVEAAPEGLRESSRNQTMSESADTLENFQEPDMPFVDLGRPVSVSLMMRGGKKRGSESRAIRRDNAVAHAQAAVDALRSWIDEKQADLDTEQEAAEETEADTSEEDGVLQELVEEVSQFCDEVEEHIAEAEGTEFPGMRG